MSEPLRARVVQGGPLEPLIVEEDYVCLEEAREIARLRAEVELHRAFVAADDALNGTRICYRFAHIDDHEYRVLMQAKQQAYAALPAAADKEGQE